VILLIAEVIAPGFFLIFIGAAAIATGLFTVLLDLGTAPQLALFALYALLAVMIGRRFYANRSSDSASRLLNDPGRRLVGKVVTVTSPVDDHTGRVRVGDSEWSARGGPAAIGERVRITGIDGNCLTVEAERVLPTA
jgi:membrane protein implicated in regulation of membrane protease activity